MKAQIRKTIIGFNREKSDLLVQELGREGIVHVDRWEAGAAGAPPAPDFAGPEGSVAALLDEIGHACADLSVSLAYRPAFGADAGEAPVIFNRDIAGDRNTIGAIRGEMDEIRTLREKCRAELAALKVRLDTARDIDALAGDPGALERMSICSHVFGTLQKEIEESDIGPGAPMYIRQAGRHVLGICMPGARDDLVGILRKSGFEDAGRTLEAYAANPRAPEEAREEAAALEAELTAKEEGLGRRMEETIGKLAGLHEIYSALGLSFEAKRAFLRTEDTEFISCWMDMEDLDRLVILLERVCGKSFYLHVFSRDEMREVRSRAPVRLRNRWFFRAFERIVRNAGVPRSLELDPTPVAAIAYLLMFGVMFGDIGQGLVLCLAGVIMKIIAERRKLSAFYHDAGTILIAAGLAAAVFGLLYGSIFSNEHIIPALWFHPMQHIMDLFFAAIMMGASFISMGLLMNIYNLFRDGEYHEAFFGIHGLLGFIVYAGCMFLAVRYVRYDIPPGTTELALVPGVPVSLFLLRSIPGRLVFGRGPMFPNGIFEYIVESFVELMEMFSGFLGNSISFIRAGAFALSHAGLSIAVYTLAGIAGPLLSAGSISIIVTGNIFIILLEGLVVGIQSMRLEYYEFFSKFFRGDGVEFVPLSFRRKQVVVRGGA